MLHLLVALSLHAPPREEHGGGDRWFSSDKVKHFFVAAFVQSVSYGTARAASVDHRSSLVGATVATTLVSVGKEVRDQRSGGHFSVRDLTWDAAGAAGATLLLERTVR
jgi:uncharacterized protein YfiM (DUF2279 family)